MRTNLFLLLTLLTSPALFGASVPPPGFVPLFNGKDLTGWRGGTTYDHRQLLALPDSERAAKIAKWTSTLTQLNAKTGLPHWRVEGAELVNDGFGDYATTERDYADFELLVDYKTVPMADSGIYLRGAPQVQIWDHTQPDPRNKGAAKGSGGLYNNDKGTPGRDPLVLADKPFGEWNHMRVVMVGSRVSVWLNEALVVDHAILQNYYDQLKPIEQRLPIPPRGPIQLQTHGGEIRWRNLYIREIGSEEACRILASHGASGFQSIFDGKDLAGWAGALDGATVQSGSIAWLQDKRGTLYWNHPLRDFQARVEFKLPPGGNNGLAVRYPGTGTPAYSGMCELQILDDNYEKIKGKIDPRQAHGSAYGMVAAARGYQHPINEWNFQEITVRGSTVQVELNGTIILDTDLSKVDLGKAASSYPGKNRTEGFFGFAGHVDPVEFRNVLVKEL